MKIVEVNEENLAQAGRIHSLAWQESHRSFCTPEFVAKHSPEAQTEYLRRERGPGQAGVDAGGWKTCGHRFRAGKFD